ncbi:hypothetical protein [Pseudonocardia sp. NPDC049154]|uniref:hypothetical protein n=1 Tax=Pseudonocardia sp. NPDC049154 TaxID=3155501 RepID=UPI0033F99FBB
MSERVRARLRLLHDEYVSAVNSAVEEGREDLVERLVADYPDAALRIMAEHDEARRAA